MRLLASLLPGSGHLQPPNWRARDHRVLFIRHQRVGDLLMATGAIRAIARSHPTVRVDVLASPASAAVLDGNPDVAAVVLFDQRRWWTWPRLLLRLRRSRYDVVVDGRTIQERAFTTTILLMLATGARCRVGVRGAPEGVFTLPVAVDQRAHLVEQTATTATPFGVDPADTDLHPSLSVSPGERERAERGWEGASRRRTDGPERARRLLVNVSVSVASRRWPEERYVAAVRHVRSREPDVTVLITGTPSDAAAVRRVAGACEAAALTPGLRDAIALVSTADLVLTPNTGLSHVASAFRTPIVEMLPRSHGAFMAYRTPGRSLLGTDETLASVSLERVQLALDEALEDLTAAPPPGR
jgi:ADP-heptose:LPS heptosyltransferase